MRRPSLLMAMDLLQHSPEYLTTMVESWHTQSATITLPLNGQVNIWTIQAEPFPPGEDVVGTVAHALELTEDLLAAPPPTNGIIVLIVDPETEKDHVHAPPYAVLPWSVAGIVSGYVRMPKEPFGGIDMAVLQHELAHFYFNRFHNYRAEWLHEGAPDLVTAYIADQDGTAKIAAREFVVSSLVDEHFRQDSSRNISVLVGPKFLHQ